MKNLSYTGILATMLILTACTEKENTQMRGPAAMPFPVVEIPAKDITAYTTYPVSIEGTINSAVRAKVSGYITDVLVDEGQKVSRGQTLFTIETAALSQDAGAAQANVNAAQVEVDKLQPLVEKGIISGVQLETAKARLAQAKANFQSVSANIGYATIKSPVDGFVSDIAYREGALVSPADPTPLTTVSDIENVYAFFSMNEVDYLDFILNTEGETLNEKLGNIPPVELVLVNGSIYSEKGEIETVTGQINTSTGTVSFRAVFPNPNHILTNGNSGSIRIPKTYKDAIVVPASASYEQQGRVYVYKVQGDTLAVSTPILVKDRVDNVIIVESGIEEGHKIVSEGVGKLGNGAPIIPQPVVFDSIVNSLKPVFK